MKNYLEAQGVACQFPRDVIKQAFQYQLISTGEIWLDMLGKRNLLPHTYDEKIASEAYRSIKYEYASPIKALVQWFKAQEQG